MSSEPTRPDSSETEETTVEKRLEALEKFKLMTESRLDNINKAIEELHEEVNRMGDRIDDLEDKVQIAGAKEHALTPIEYAVIWYADDVTECRFLDGEAQFRAARIAIKFNDWSTKTKSRGRVLKTRDDSLRQLYSEAWDEKINSKQLYRALDEAEKLSEGKLLHEKLEDNQHRLRKPVDQTLYETTDELEDNDEEGSKDE